MGFGIMSGVFLLGWLKHSFIFLSRPAKEEVGGRVVNRHKSL
jgi:hypothetical protein